MNDEDECYGADRGSPYFINTFCTKKISHLINPFFILFVDHFIIIHSANISAESGSVKKLG